jgi:ribonucleoside-diphosphate reductase alpha chain
VPLTPNALAVLRKRYLIRDEAGKVVETPEQLWKRVATAVAKTPEDAARYEAAMAALDFLPNSPALMNAGRKLGQLFACFVIPVEDHLVSPDDNGIFDAIRTAAVIHQSGGGTGFSFSHLRSEGSRVETTGGRSSGPVSFMRIFNAATEAIQQGGFRRGANMAILRVDHPDILDFIDLKSDPREMGNFNISVGVTDAFLDAVTRDALHEVVDPHTKRRSPLREKMRDDHGNLLGSGSKVFGAREVFERLCRRAWESGEPGLVFLDRIARFNPTPAIGAMEATNPCGEVPLLPFEACNLASINLAHFADGGDIAWPRLRETIRLAVRFLDDVIDANRYPKPPIEAIVKGNRKIGLGIMGWADLLFRLSLRYDSDAALTLARKLMKFVKEEGWQASMDLAAERGPFPNHARSIYVEKDHPLFSDGFRSRPGPMRNATVTCVAPTGTISILAGCTSGIEPAFSLAFTRHVLDGATLPEVNPVFEAVAKREGFWSEELVDRLAAGESPLTDDAIPPRWREVFVRAHDIAPDGHLRMQAAFQEFTDNAVSKTVNFPQASSPDDVRRVYELAVQLGVKGVTVYRDKSRTGQPMALEAVACREC